MYRTPHQSGKDGHRCNVPRTEPAPTQTSSFRTRVVRVRPQVRPENVTGVHINVLNYMYPRKLHPPVLVYLYKSTFLSIRHSCTHLYCVAHMTEERITSLKLNDPESFVMRVYFRSLRRILRFQRATERPREDRESELEGTPTAVLGLREKEFRPVTSVLCKRGFSRQVGF